MTIIVRGFLNELLVTRGYVASTVVPLVLYVDPRAARFVASASTSDPFAVDSKSAQLIH